MKKIMIVDDNEINRLVIRSMIEMYSEEHEVEFDISEASDGIEAVALNLQSPHQIIFMDIMMPNMDGIEATYRIRKQDPKVMVIAVSATNDAEYKKVILQKGAEDYISKPINMDIFLARFTNYISIVETRNNDSKPNNTLAWNLYTKDIFSHRLMFFIRDEDELSQFWEYFLFNNKNNRETLSDAVRTLYSIGLLALKDGYSTQIIVEESLEEKFMTITNIKNLSLDSIKLIIQKNYDLIQYKTDHENLTIKIPNSNIVNSQNTNEKKIENLNSVSTPILDSTYESKGNAAALYVYNYMYKDDLEEMREYIHTLNSLLLLVRNGYINTDEVKDIIFYLDKIGKIAFSYAESESIGRSLIELAIDIEYKIDIFIEKSRDLALLCSAFGHDLESWYQQTFQTGTPSVNYMDDMISSNVNMICILLAPQVAIPNNDIEVDDIFNF